MSLRHCFRLLLSVCIAMMLLGPVACASASATHATHAQAMDDMALHDMDCCPGKHPPPPCPKCPLMALCASPAIVASLPEAIATPVWHLGQRSAPTDEPALVGRGASPPLEPPRS